ncbi:MAG: glycoside hydrolase family 13 protein [Desulfurococcaceae archaeon TW002]
MYEVVGRERIGPHYGRLTVIFSIPDMNYRNAYLSSFFTSFAPSYFRLSRKGSRWSIKVKVWDGEYPYVFVVNNSKIILDPENPEKACLRPFPENRNYEVTVSIARLGEENPKSIKPWHVIHLSTDPSYASIYEGSLVLRLRAHSRIVEECYAEILANDSKKFFRGSKIGHIGYYDIYEVVMPEATPINIYYRFIVKTKSRELLTYGSEGLGSEELIRFSGDVMVEFPWYLGTTYYLIFPDSFRRSSGSEANYQLEWGVAPRPHGFLGGNLKGIIDSLDYISNLGIETLYLTPIFKSPSYHRYDVEDYFSVDPKLGDLRLFQELLNKAKKLGIKVIIDLPVHHTSVCNELFVKAVLSREYRDLYYFHQEPGEALVKLVKDFLEGMISCVDLRNSISKLSDVPYETFLDVKVMPKLNVLNKYVREYVTKVIDFWLGVGVDGFRMDVGQALPPEFVEVLKKELEVRKKDVLLLGEATSDPVYLEELLSSGRYDSLMNYGFMRDVLMLLNGMADLNYFINSSMSRYSVLSPLKSLSLYNLLGSHDVPRIKTLVEDPLKLEIAYVLLFSLAGSPSLYYGDEIGMVGDGDPDNRRGMIWDESMWDKELLKLIKELIRVRSICPLMKKGLMSMGRAGDLLTITRYLISNQALTIINVSEEPSSINKVPDGLSPIMSRRVDVTEDKLVFKKYGFIIYC